MVFAAIWIVLGVALWGLDAAGRHQQAMEARNDATSNFFIRLIRLKYRDRYSIPQLEADLNSGRSLSRQLVDSPYGTCDQITLDGASIARQHAGWTIQVGYSITPLYHWTYIHNFPPPARSKFMARVGSEEVRQAVEKLRLLLLIICASTWLIVVAPALVAGPMRRELGQVAMAAALLALLAWSADPDRRTFASLPPLNWIFITATGGFVIGLLAALLPVRVSQKRSDRCPNCRYDLTGNVSGTCPECGNPTPAELRRRHDEELEPLAQAIASTTHLVTERSQCGDDGNPEFPRD